MKKDIFSSKESEKEELKKKADEVLHLDQAGKNYVDCLIDYAFSIGRLDRMFEELRSK